MNITPVISAFSCAVETHCIECIRFIAPATITTTRQSFKGSPILSSLSRLVSQCAQLVPDIKPPDELGSKYPSENETPSRFEHKMQVHDKNRWSHEDAMKEHHGRVLEARSWTHDAHGRRRRAVSRRLSTMSPDPSRSSPGAPVSVMEEEQQPSFLCKSVRVEGQRIG